MKKVSKIAEALLVFFLSFMSILIVLNVILRYIFDSGIIWSEEMTRYLFVWLTILGAMIALKESMHFKVDILTNALPRKFSNLLIVIGNMIVLYLLWIIFDGSLKMTEANLNNTTPVVGIPLTYVYSCGMIMSVVMALIVVRQTFRTFGNKEDIIDENDPTSDHHHI